MNIETYDFKSIEQKWQKKWEESHAFSVSDPNLKSQISNPKFYCLVMFPYPSGKIHMGHARNYCIGDVIARYKKMRGFNVLHPIGWDAFGLPAENAAIERGENPQKWTEKNISDMRQDIKLLGISYDWDREFATCNADYYKWNQWFFIQMFKKGLAYKKKSSVNWCPKCQTVLANEQVHDGSCWRCHSAVMQKDLEQWFFKITDYAERLLEDLKLLEGKWPDEVIAMQRNWIGKSVGAEVNFQLEDSVERRADSKDKKSDSTLNAKRSALRIFTTRPDTLFGCTFMVLAPEHPLVLDLLKKNPIKEIKEYCEMAKKETKIERTAADREKTGVFSGLYAINPVNNAKIPVWIADYVLADYGTGAIMAVPAHDQRDFEFAKKYKLPIIKVIQSKDSLEKKDSVSQLSTLDSQLNEAYEGEGNLINSGEFTGQSSAIAAEKITDWLDKKGIGKKSVTYRIRDWLISRQRYWGTPIPVIYCPKCGAVPANENDLPVLLPKNVEFTGKGESPLTQVKEFINTKCPKCAGEAKRETDTMDTFVDSSWYYLRYCDPKNETASFDSKKTNGWMPVDQYIGGIEHACMHLVYSRFFYKFIADIGIVNGAEPFERLLTQGMVTLGGSAMSKSKGNIVAVETMANEYGADTARIFILFASPPKNQLEWSEEGVKGAWRFLNRIWRMGKTIANNEKRTSNIEDHSLIAHRSSLQRKTHQTIKKVEDDIERDYQFNTVIAALMELLNVLSDYPNLGDETSRESFMTLLILLYPFAPHLASEIWEELDFQPEEIGQISFPKCNPELIKESEIEIVIQVNGKLRAKILVPAQDSKDEKKVVLLAQESLKNKNFDKTENYKFVPGRLVNFVV